MPNTELSEFFSIVSKERNENLEKLKTKIKTPESDLANLFEQLETAHKEVTKISDEPSEEKILTEEDQNRLDVFSNLVNTLNSTKEILEEVEVVQEIEPEEIEESEEVISEVFEEVVKADNIIDNIVSTLDEMGEKTAVKEEIDQIAALRNDFDNFKNLIQRDIANQKMSGAGSGEVRLEFLDDVDRDTAKVNDKALVYDSTSGKWKGETFLTGVLTDLDIDGGTDIGAALADADLFIVDDGAGGTNRKTAASRIKTYVSDVTLTTAAQSNITSVGTLTSLTVDNIIINGTNIGHTSDTDALAIDSSGNITASQNLTVSGDLVVTGTTKTVDTVTMEAANAVIFEGTTADSNETTLTIVDPTADHTQYLINQTGYIPLLAASTTTAISSTPAELNLLDGSSANSVVNSKAVIYGSSGEVAGTLSTAAQGNVTSLGTLTALTVDDVVINGATIGHGDDTDLMTVADGVLTVAGELDAATLDISGNADIDGTLEADAYTVDGTALNEYIADTVGAMVGSNTETNITVTYQDGDNTLDFVIGTLNQDTTGNADTATLSTNFTVSANNSTDETVYPVFVDGATGTQGAETDTGLSYNPSTGVLTTTSVTGNLTGNVTGNTSGTAATVTTAAQTNITSLGTLTTLTVDNVIINGATIGHTSDTDLMTVADGVLTVAGELDAATLDISGNADIDGTLEADAYTVDGTALNEYIADTVGAMVGSNTETNITVTYEDGDNTLDFVIGTLNQDTTGTADNFTVSANNSTDETVYPIFVDGATGSQGAESDTGLSYNPSTGVLTTTSVTGNLTGNVTGNVTGNTSGTAATVTTAAQSSITSLGTLTTLTVDNIIINGTNIGHTSDTDAIAIASNGVVTFSQNPVFPDGGVAIADLDIDGGTDINAALVDADLLIVDDGAGGTNRKTTMSRVKTYINAIDDATAMAIALG